MDKRMVLVPETWLRQQSLLNETPDGKDNVQISLVEPKKEAELTELAQHLPKSYRSRGRILLHDLQGHVKLNEQQRVIYPNNQLGSHIFDLVKYFVATFPTDRPMDAPKFAKMMAQAGVPSSALAKKRTTTIGQTEKRFETRDGRKVFLFHSGYNPLSTFNFGSFVYNEQRYYNLEQFYQVQKAKTCGDSDTVIELLRTKSAKRCKEIGRNTQNYDPELWEAKAEDVMYAGALERFMQNATYRDYLKATGNAIIGEATRFDNYWAIVLDIGDPANEDVDSWPGRNSYGQILMRVREGIMNLDKKRN